MKASPVRALVAATIVLALSGCAQPQPAVTDDPVVTAPSDEATPDAKPTAAAGGPCFDAYAVGSGDEEHGGDVTWPAPLTDQAIGVEPSCWYDALDSEVNLFLAGWYGLDDAQYDLVNTPIEDALVGAGYQLTDDTNGISRWALDEPETPGFQITRTDGFYELAVTVGHA